MHQHHNSRVSLTIWCDPRLPTVASMLADPSFQSAAVVNIGELNLDTLFARASAGDL